MSVKYFRTLWDFVYLRPGSWATSSRTDPRFNLCGRGLVGHSISPDVQNAVKGRERELGCLAPDDLSMSFGD